MYAITYVSRWSSTLGQSSNTGNNPWKRPGRHNGEQSLCRLHSEQVYARKACALMPSIGAGVGKRPAELATRATTCPRAIGACMLAGWVAGATHAITKPICWAAGGYASTTLQSRLEPLAAKTRQCIYDIINEAGLRLGFVTENSTQHHASSLNRSRIVAADMRQRGMGLGHFKYGKHTISC